MHKTKPFNELVTDSANKEIRSIFQIPTLMMLWGVLQTARSEDDTDAQVQIAQYALWQMSEDVEKVLARKDAEEIKSLHSMLDETYAFLDSVKSKIPPLTKGENKKDKEVLTANKDKSKV